MYGRISAAVVAIPWRSTSAGIVEVSGIALSLSRLMKDERHRKKRAGAGRKISGGWAARGAGCCSAPSREKFNVYPDSGDNSIHSLLTNDMSYLI